MAYKKKIYDSKPQTKESVHSELVKEEKNNFPLSRKNFIIMIVAAVMIVVGYLLMMGSGSTVDHFNPDIFSARRIIVGPTISFLGFVLMGVGIVYLPLKKRK